MIGRGFLLVVAGHLAVVAAMLAGSLPVTVAAILHALLTLAALHLATRADVSIAAVAASPLGPTAMLAAYALARGSRRLRPADPAVLAADGGRGPANDRRLTDRIEDNRLRSPDADRIVSFADALRQGDVALRQAVVGVVVRNFQPALSPLIATALTDADQALRTQAAAAVAEIEQDVARRRARFAADPGGAAQLFDLLADHAEANVLLSPTNRRAMMQDAVRAGTLALDDLSTPPARMAIVRRQARLLCAADEGAAAVALLDPLVDPRTASVEDIVALVEALVADRAYATLALLAQVVQLRPEPLPPEPAAMIAFWLDRQAA